MSLGHRAALADVIYANVLVSYGLHFKEKRRFEFAGQYLDTINALDPTFSVPYRYADTLLILQPVAPRQAGLPQGCGSPEAGDAQPTVRPIGVEHSRAVLRVSGAAAPQRRSAQAGLAPRRGQDAGAGGANCWARTTGFPTTASPLPRCSPKPAKKRRPFGSWNACSRSATILKSANSPRAIWPRSSAKSRGRRTTRKRNALYEEFLKDVPFVPKDLYLLLGPRIEPGACAGLPMDDSVRCASSWRAWAAAQRDAP